LSRKTFKIERLLMDQNGPAGQPPAAARRGARSGECAGHHELMKAIGEIRNLLEGNQLQSSVPTEMMEKFRADMEEAARLKAELENIQKAIDHTKHEIAALRLPGDNSTDITRMTSELGAIVEGTEEATENILSAVEQIDENATDLLAGLKGNQRDMCSDIQEQVVKIYEACNFQDLTGQRISKVVKAFGFIEQRVEQMMEIWGGIDSFKGFEPPASQPDGSADGSHLLNGPSLAHDTDTVSQDDIDAMFG